MHVPSACRFALVRRPYSRHAFVHRSHKKDKIHKYGHIHLDDIAERRDRFKNEVIIASHLSTRYSAKQALRLVERKLPDMLDGRLRLWV